MLLFQSNKSGFMRNVGLFQVLPQFLNLCFSLLVKFNLCMSGSSSLIEPFTKALKLPSKIRSLSFSLGSSLSFSFQLFLQFFNSDLKFLDSFLKLSNICLFFIQFD